LEHANFCKNTKVCTFCASRRAEKQRAETMLHFDRYPDLYKKHHYMIVLTLKRSKKDTLEDLIAKMTK
jgi:hypothetical protein